MKSETVFGKKKALTEYLKLPEDFQGLPEGKVVISQDWKTQEGKIVKRFRCISNSDVRTLVNKSKNRANFYEILHEWKKCKLYFDVDLTPDRIPEGKSKEDLFREFPIWLKDCVHRYFGVPHDVEVDILLFDSSRSDKVSLHAHVMDVCAPNPKTVKWLVSQMIAEENWMSKFVDPVPYGKFQNWRLPLCSKFGKDNKKTPIWPATGEIVYKEMLVSVTNDKMFCVSDKTEVQLSPRVLAAVQDLEDGLRPASVNIAEGFDTDLWNAINEIPNGGQGQGFKVRNAVMKACGNAALKYRLDGKAHFLKWLSNRSDYNSRMQEWIADYDRYVQFISRVPVGTLKVYDHIQKYSNEQVYDPTSSLEEFESANPPLRLSSSDIFSKLWVNESGIIKDFRRNRRVIAHNVHSVVAALGSNFIRKTGPCQWKREAKFPMLDRQFTFEGPKKPKQVKLKDVWNQEGPPEYNSILFDPNLSKEEAREKRILQTFRGYPIVSAAKDLLFDELEDNEEFLKEKCRPILKLLTRIAYEPDPEKLQSNLDYLLNHLAWLLQKPGHKIPKAIYIEGPQGSGKSAFAALLEKLFAPYFLAEKGLDFFERRFNVELECISVLFLDEAQGTGGSFNIRGLTGKAKEVVTGHRMQMEQKFFDPVTLKNHINVFMATDQIGKLHMEMDDRRIVKFKILEGPVGWNHEYYPAIETPEIMAHFALLLLNRDLSNFDPQQQHETIWNRMARLASLSVPARALKELLTENEYAGWELLEKKGEKVVVSLKLFIMKYEDACSIRAKKNIDPIPLAIQACKELGLNFDPQTRTILAPIGWSDYFEKLVTGKVRGDSPQ